MGRKKKTDGGALFPRYRQEKISVGVELKKLPPAMPELEGNKKAIQLYEYIGNELISCGKLATTDIFILQIYCLELADYLKLRELVGTVENEIEFDGRRSQTSRLMEKKMNTVLKLSTQLGITPFSRSGVAKVSPTEPGLGTKAIAASEIDLD